MDQIKKLLATLTGGNNAALGKDGTLQFCDSQGIGTIR